VKRTVTENPQKLINVKLLEKSLLKGRAVSVEGDGRSTLGVPGKRKNRSAGAKLTMTSNFRPFFVITGQEFMFCWFQEAKQRQFPI